MVIPIVKLGVAMRVSGKRWGEITIKKQGERKNRFDQTKSFSIEQTDTNYTIEEYFTILQMATNLTEKMRFIDLERWLARK